MICVIRNRAGFRNPMKAYRGPLQHKDILAGQGNADSIEEERK